MTNKFRATLNRGFALVFKNGVEISVQWGYGNYCSNRDLTKGYLDSTYEHIFESETAEVLILDGDKNITRLFAKEIDINPTSEVLGWLDAEQVADAISWAKNYRGELYE